MTELVKTVLRKRMVVGWRHVARDRKAIRKQQNHHAMAGKPLH